MIVSTGDDGKRLTVRERALLLLSNWISGYVPDGLVEDVVLFAKLYGEEAQREDGMNPEGVA